MRVSPKRPISANRAERNARAPGTQRVRRVVSPDRRRDAGDRPGGAGDPWKSPAVRITY